MRVNKRDDILEGARRAFYAQGIAASGVDAIAEEARVSKRTLYNHFASKEDLVLAYIRWRDDLWRDLLAGYLEGVEDPVERLVAYVEAYLDDSIDPEYRGCPMINAAAELVDDGPTMQVIAETKERARRDVEELLQALGHPDPETQSTVIITLLEGACALGGVRRQRLDAAPLIDAALSLAGVERAR